MSFENLDFVPKTEVRNIREAIEDVIKQTEHFAIDKEIDYDLFNTYIQNVSRDVHVDDSLCTCPPRQVKWFWEYREDDTIKIDIPNVTPDQITVTDTSIQSPAISGDWWAPIDNLLMVQAGDSTALTFTSNVYFPVPIRGGNIDALSSYFLAMLSFKLKKFDFFLEFGRKACHLRDPTALQLIGRHLLTLNALGEAMNYFCHGTLLYNDPTCGTLLAAALWSKESPVYNPAVSEHLFCGYARMGNPDAFFGLGQLYLSGGGDIPADHGKAIQLFRIASETFGMEEAADVLQQIDQALKQSHQRKAQAQAQAQAVAQNVAPAPDQPKEESTSLIDIAIAGGIVASVLGIGFYIFRKFRR